MKLPNGFGSVYKLSGNRRNPWVARKTTGWTFDEVKQKSFPVYKFVGYYPTRKDALNALTAYNNDPYDLSNKKVTFAEVFEMWSNQHFPKVSESNIKGYNASFRTCREIHNLPIVEIKLSHLQKVVDDSGKNYPMLKKLKIMLGLVWDYAVIHEIVTPDRRDFIKYLDIDKGNPNKIDRTPFTRPELETLWNAEGQNQYISVILILIYTGCRVGELLDLKKEDVHLDERWFYVRESKTESGVREVPIAEKIVPFFKRWLNVNGDYLITTPEGKHFEYRNYYDSYWKPIVDMLGLKHRPHDTRHTCVSMLTAVNVDERIIKQIVGHKGQGVTQAIYTHIQRETKLEAINKI